MNIRRTIILAAAAVALSACGTSIPDREPGNTTTQRTSERATVPGAPGRPEKTDAGKVPGAPIRIPAFTELQGLPLVTVRDLAETRIAKECDDCVRIATAVDSTATQYSVCQYVSFRGGQADPTPNEESPNGSVILTRGSTLTLITGPSAPQQLPCGTEGYLPKTSVTDDPDPTTGTTPTTARPTSKPRVTPTS
ncbi:hypothetical protein [Nocardia sp. CS682]|uniref:hypothetical protein n=1 Tax=Nocardia sp. CS682 TaxID=1047172 RepID=UPI001074CA48|nr:hypothetical protein [Nocardia sp. CS682]